MIVLTAFYPFILGGRFDEDYFRSRHISLMQEIWGDLIQSVDLVSGRPGLDGSDPAYRMCAHISFASMEAVGSAMTSPRLGELIDDVANYTDNPSAMHVGER